MRMQEEQWLRTRTASIILDWAEEREPPFSGLGKADFAEAIVAAHVVADEARLNLNQWIAAARRADMSWAEIGKTLGISKQAAQQRFGRATGHAEEGVDNGTFVRTGATAFNELRILAGEGRKGNELVALGALTLSFRPSEQTWEYCRRIGTGSDTTRMQAEGWEHVASWLPFHYYKRVTE
ncbi:MULTISPECIES: hypothetical protein [unclassified Sphingomonas]|uniref:hypothetical protein n=1 Tax=unclassified Sphingomonas TaxID=196159 RepID=UPI0007022BA2|nr:MULTISPECIES: hypothetical protein [unclassified Sphingomonas]KQM28522.1 hypothetical protein ASE58_01150 [Sphingomonas sp. Leaf9]KQM45228.1 hypothetical protein ASE57_01150 [Sphingomonas sp. Leaf11]